jgi:hypothetical protein
MNAVAITCPSCNSTFTAFPNAKTACPRCAQPVVVGKPENPFSSEFSKRSRTGLVIPLLTLVIGLLGGYFAGREHLKYEIRSTLHNAAKGIADVFAPESAKAKEAVKPDKREENDYINQNLEISGLKAKYEKDVLDRWETIVRATIKNNGDKTIKKLKVTAYFLDRNESTISEDSFYPILDSTFKADASLKPHYIREFAFKAEHVPSEWKEGRVRLAITDIAFENESQP